MRLLDLSGVSASAPPGSPLSSGSAGSYERRTRCRKPLREGGSASGPVESGKETKESAHGPAIQYPVRLRAPHVPGRGAARRGCGRGRERDGQFRNEAGDEPADEKDETTHGAASLPGQGACRATS